MSTREFGLYLPIHPISDLSWPSCHLSDTSALCCALCGRYNSFAHATMGVRLPTILGKAIEDTVRTLNEQSEEEIITDLVGCIERLEVLMEDLQKNSKHGFVTLFLFIPSPVIGTFRSSQLLFTLSTDKLRPILDDNEADVSLWNKEIAKYFRGKDFMNAPWLFAEAYKYRRLRESFSMSKHWKDYDVFFRQKVCNIPLSR